MKPPAVILINPQMAENIGAVARAMSNFGLKELRLVAPRDGWPSQRARDVASGGAEIIDKAKLYSDFPSALKGIEFAYATTARERDMEKRVLEPREAVRSMKTHMKSGGRVAIVFGPERTGIENDDISLCDHFVTIPTAPGHFSLNLAQAVVIIGYEWLTQIMPAAKPKAVTEVAPKEDWLEMFGQLEKYLDESGYFRVPAKKPIMWQNLRNMLMRARFSVQEMRSFRGMLRVLAEGRKSRQ
jgi:tRNA/rRNA methyltransferase